MRLCILLLLFVLGPALVAAEEITTRNGTDVFIAGDALLTEVEGPGDAFVAAQSTTLSGTASGDLHVGGFDVSVSADVREDLYAAGASVSLLADVARDTTAAAFTLRTGPSARMAGNVRLAGNSVTIEGPIEGALSVVGRTVILNAPVNGDVRITANTLSFGDNARVAGTLSYSTPAAVTVPESVAPPNRVQFTEMDFARNWEGMRDMIPDAEMPVFPAAASIFGAFVISLLFFMTLGALALAFMPVKLERMRLGIALAPGRSILLGVIGLSLLIGLVPILVMTLVGLPFVPIILLAIVVTWTLGYAMGGYAIAMKIWRALGGETEPSALVRVLLIAGAVTAVALLNFIPFVGWVANFTLVLLGVGAITRLVLAGFITDIDPALDVDMRPTTETNGT